MKIEIYSKIKKHMTDNKTCNINMKYIIKIKLHIT